MPSPKQSDSHLEQRFANLWNAVAPDLPIEPQKKNIVPGRKYVYDFFVPSANVLLEINGGLYARGNSGHTSAEGITRDYEKSTLGQMQGYDVFLLAPAHLNKEYISYVANYCRTKATRD